MSVMGCNKHHPNLGQGFCKTGEAPHPSDKKYFILLYLLHTLCIHVISQVYSKAGKYPLFPVPQSVDDMHGSTTDNALNAFNYKDFPALRWALAKLAVKVKDKNLDITF